MISYNSITEEEGALFLSVDKVTAVASGSFRCPHGILRFSAMTHTSTRTTQDDQVFSVGTSIEFWEGKGGDKHFESVMKKAKAKKTPRYGVSQASKLLTDAASLKSAREGPRKLLRSMVAR